MNSNSAAHEELARPVAVPRHAGAAATSPADGNGGLPLDRAEEIVDRLGERVGYYALNFGRNLARWTARLREEAEDILAEAESVRRGETLH